MKSLNQAHLEDEADIINRDSVDKYCIFKSIRYKTKPWHDRWWFLALEALVIAASIIGTLYEVGCFDK